MVECQISVHRGAKSRSQIRQFDVFEQVNIGQMYDLPTVMFLPTCFYSKGLYNLYR